MGLITLIIMEPKEYSLKLNVKSNDEIASLKAPCLEILDIVDDTESSSGSISDSELFS